MYRTLRRVLCALCIPAAILGIVQSASGDATRAFTGSYQLSNIVEAGSSVDVTMTLVLHNPGTSDVKGGIVVLMDTQPHHLFLGSFGTIKSLPHLGQVTVTKSFTIPAEEYERWKTGNDPTFQFLVPSSAGTNVEGIQAAPVTKIGETN
jgi:hypothetical protein